MKYLLLPAMLLFGCSKPKAVEPAAMPPPAPPLEFAIPVPGMPGFVKSPYSPDSGYVDVRGFPSNTEVKDPYSGRIFKVP